MIGMIVQILFVMILQCDYIFPHYRWLEVQIINLTSTQYWVVYLKLLQEAIWPGGALPKYPKPARTQEQKMQTQELALQCLMKMLPG